MARYIRPFSPLQICVVLSKHFPAWLKFGWTSFSRMRLNVCPENSTGESSAGNRGWGYREFRNYLLAIVFLLWVKWCFLHWNAFASLVILVLSTAGAGYLPAQWGQLRLQCAHLKHKGNQHCAQTLAGAIVFCSRQIQAEEQTSARCFWRLSPSMCNVPLN